MKRTNSHGGGTNAASADDGLSPLSLLWFSAEWCGPCKQMAPAAERVEALFQGRLDLQKIDVDKNPQLAAEFNIRGVPTLLLTRDNEVVAQQVGAAPLTTLVNWLDRHLDS